MFKPTLRYCGAAATLLVVLFTTRGQLVDETTYPSQPIELVVPFGAGGGTDTFARIVEKAIEDNDLLPQPIVISNVGGAGATIGSRRVKDAKPDGYKVLILHEALITAKYYGQVNYGPEAFEPIAGTGEIGLVVAVWEDSPYENLTDLLKQAKQHPDELVFAANLGAPAHFVGLRLERNYPGATFRFTQSGGGANRFADLKGGHADATVFSIQEYEAFKSQEGSDVGGIRAIAVCQLERHPAIPDVPTTHEQGIPVTHINMQFWWMPKGTPRSRIEVFAAALKKAMQTEIVQQRMADIHCNPVFVRGDAMQAEVDAREAAISNVDLRPARQMPDLTMGIFFATLGLGLFVAVATLRERARSRHTETTAMRYDAAVGFTALTVVYVAALATPLVDFRFATAFFVLLVGGVLTRFDTKIHPAPTDIALVMSLGIHFVFTHFFELTLP